MTPAELVQTEINRFLSTIEPEVICIRGKWGVGKTFTWQAILRNAINTHSVQLSRYSYISLFGINSLDGLKNSIFENLEFLQDDSASKWKKIASSHGNRLFDLYRKSRSSFSEAPYIGDAIRVAAPLLFSSITEQLICIDDLERRGDGLSVRDVLGLVSFLKEQRRCKIILLLNDRELDENGASDFDSYKEKVIDATLLFDPDARYSVSIALSDDNIAMKKISENCISLGVSNIRTIKMIERFVKMIIPLLSEHGEKVLHQAIHSITLFVWAKSETNLAPSIEFIKSKRRVNYSRILGKEGEDEKEVGWNAVLDAYRFVRMDDFDKVLLDSVDNGFFNPDIIKEKSSDLQKQYSAQEKMDAMSDAWSLFHDSFDDNEHEIVSTLDKALRENLDVNSPSNLDEIVSLFKGLGYHDKAASIIDFYVNNRNEEPRFWDVNNLPFPLQNAEIIEAFDKKISNVKEKLDPVAALIHIASGNGWTIHHISALDSLSVDQFYEIFNNHRGATLNKLITGALHFGRVSNATTNMQTIVATARAALLRIGKESNLNAVRVGKYGVQVPEEPDHAKSGSGP